MSIYGILYTYKFNEKIKTLNKMILEEIKNTYYPASIEKIAELARNINERRLLSLGEKIRRKTANKYNISTDQIKVKTRRRKYSEPRQVSMYLHKVFYNNHSMTLEEIGKEHGGFDHSTVLHAQNMIPKIILYNKTLREKVESIEKEVRAIL